MAAVAEAPLLLILRALGLGDLLTAVPALRALAHAYPDHRRLLAAPADLAPLVRLSGAVHELVDVAPLMPLPRGLGRPEVAVNLHGRGPQSYRLLQAIRPRRLIAYAHQDAPESWDAPHWRADEHEVARWCRLLDEFGIPADPCDLDLSCPRFDGPDWMRGATVIHPGAGSRARRWPACRWAAVAAIEREAGRDVVITGGPGEHALAQSVAADAGLGAEGVCAGLDLLGLAALLGAAGRIACADTGVAHLATALRVPSVVIFGPTSPLHWGPPPARRCHRVLWTGGAGGDPHGPRPDPALLAVGPRQVARALAEIA